MAKQRTNWCPSSRVQPTADSGVVEIMVDNRTMLLGLDKMYRDLMKCYETEKLLLCAQEVCSRLGIGPSSCPVEGYYTESAELRRYFLLMRSLQGQTAGVRSRVQEMDAFRLLEKVTSSSIFGRKDDDRHLLPLSRTSLTDALENLQGRWNVKGLVEQAQRIARTADDYSLTGLAARAGDPVVLAALRESVSLYEMLLTGRKPHTVTYRYIWCVDDDLCRAANAFVESFNELVGEHYGGLPPVVPELAQRFSCWATLNDVVGRCICIGRTQSGGHYHWAVCMRREDEEAPGSLYVDEFWSQELWTTERYRTLQRNKLEMRAMAERGDANG